MHSGEGEHDIGADGRLATVRSAVRGLLDQLRVDEAIELLEASAPDLSSEAFGAIRQDIEAGGGWLARLRTRPAALLTPTRRDALVARSTTTETLTVVDVGTLSATDLLNRMLADPPPHRAVLCRRIVELGHPHWAACEVLLALRAGELDRLSALIDYPPDLPALAEAMAAAGLPAVGQAVVTSLAVASEGRLSEAAAATVAPTADARPGRTVTEVVWRALREVAGASPLARAPFILERRYAPLGAASSLWPRPSPLHSRRFRPAGMGPWPPAADAGNADGNGEGNGGGGGAPSLPPTHAGRTPRVVATREDPRTPPGEVVGFAGERAALDRSAGPAGTIWVDALPRRGRPGWAVASFTDVAEGELTAAACAHPLVRYLAVAAATGQAGRRPLVRSAIGWVSRHEPTWASLAEATGGRATAAPTQVCEAVDRLAWEAARGRAPAGVARVARWLPDVAGCIARAGRLTIAEPPEESAGAQVVIELPRPDDPASQVALLVLAIGVVAAQAVAGPAEPGGDGWERPTGGAIRVRRRASSRRVVAPVRLIAPGPGPLPLDLSLCLRSAGCVEAPGGQVLV